MRWKESYTFWVSTFFPVFNKYEQPASHLPIIKLLSNCSIRDELRIPKFHPKGHPKSKIEQESIPVGCVPYPVVSYVPCIWGWGGQTDTCENITFPQLSLRTVNISYSQKWCLIGRILGGKSLTFI